MRLLLLLLTCLLTINIEAKVRILTFHYNLPELIEIQHKTLKKFIKDDYELIVFNDAKDPEVEVNIQKTCDKFGIRCVRFEQEWHKTDPFNRVAEGWMNDPTLYSHIGHLKQVLAPEYLNYNHASLRHCHVIQFALNEYGYKHNDLVLILDGDCFPSRPTNLKKLLGNNHIIGTRKQEGNYDYLWVVFSLFNPKKAPYKNDLRFNIDVINNEIHDTGAHTYHYLNHPEVVYQKIERYNSAGYYHWTDEDMRAYGFNAHEIAFLRDLDSLKGFAWPITVEFHMDKHFIHLGNSSFGFDGAKEKLECVKRLLRKVAKTDF